MLFHGRFAAPLHPLVTDPPTGRTRAASFFDLKLVNLCAFVVFLFAVAR